MGARPHYGYLLAAALPPVLVLLLFFLQLRASFVTPHLTTDNKNSFTKHLSNRSMVPAIKPRYILATYLGLCFVFIVAAMNTNGMASIAILILVLCFESACFATIFTLGLRGLGRHTKVGGSLLVAAISGGMVFPPMCGAVVTQHNAHVAMAIPMMGYILAWVYPLYVNIWNGDTMDIHRATTVGLETSNDKNIELEAQESRAGNHAPTATEVK